MLLIWELVCRIGLVPNYLLPAPSQVIVALFSDAPLMATHAATTLIEALIGLVLGVVIGFVIAVVMDRFDAFYLAISPLMTLSQTIPTIAIAPLLVLWLGYGMLPKIVLVILTSFFPIAISLIEGFRSLDPDYVDLLTTMGASRTQIFIHAKLPAAAGQFFSGLRISATYAIVAAVIAEWLGGFSGLGVYMTRVRKSFSYDRMFASILVVSGISLGLLALVNALERRCVPWRRPERKDL